MPPLHLALQGGFAGETVVVKVNGREVFRNPEVKTRMQIGLAADFEVDVPAGTARIEVEIPERKTSTSFEVPITAGATYVGISLDRSGKIEHVVSDQPFGYV